MFPEVISVFNRWLNGIFLCFSKPLVQGRCTSNSAFFNPPTTSTLIPTIQIIRQKYFLRIA